MVAWAGGTASNLVKYKLLEVHILIRRRESNLGLPNRFAQLFCMIRARTFTYARRVELGITCSKCIILLCVG